jgi:copper(I)-binding protein
VNRTISRRTLITSAAVLSLAGIAGTRSSAHQSQMSGTPGPMGGTGAAFLTIANSSDFADRLVGAKTAAAKTVEIHEMRNEGDVMKMAPLDDGLEIPAGATVELKPGGFHIMMIGLTKNLKAGESFELTLTFEQAGEVALTVPICVSKEAAEAALAQSQDKPVLAGDLAITGVWSRQAPAMMAESSPSPAPAGPPMGGFAGVGAAFMVITNSGSDADLLLGASTDLAERVELDEIRIGSGGMAMIPLHDGLPIPAGETVTITPGKYHILLYGLKRDLVAGESFDLTLSFEKAGEATFPVPIFASSVDAEAAASATPVQPATAGDLMITGIWSAAAKAAPDGTPVAAAMGANT